MEAFAGEDIFDIPETEIDTFKTAEGESLLAAERPPLHRGKLAQLIFSDEEKRAVLNAIVHPAVKLHGRYGLRDE